MFFSDIAKGNLKTFDDIFPWCKRGAKGKKKNASV